MESTPQQTSTVIVFIARKRDTTPTSFRTYYEQNHIPWVTSLILSGPHKPLSYTRHYLNRDADGDGSSSSFPMGGAEKFQYDCVTQLVFRNQGDRDATLQAFGQYAEEIARDEATFMDREATLTLFVGESVATKMDG